MKKIVLLFVCSFVASFGISQQMFQQTQFMVNPYTLNPALAGSEDFFDLKAGYRNQWVGLSDDFNEQSGNISPRTMYISGHTSLGHDHGYYRDPRHEHKAFHGVGGYVTSDQIGAFSSNSIYGSYSYNMLLLKSKKGGQMYGFNGQDRHIGVRMIIGAHIGAVNQRIDFSRLVSKDPDPAVAAAAGEVGQWSPDGSLGLWMYSNKYYLGLAIRRIAANEVSIDAVGYDGFSLSRYYNAMAGYKFMLSDFILFEPSLNVKFEAGAAPSTDINGLLVYDNTYTNSKGTMAHKNKDLHVYLGTTYRVGSVVAFLVGGVIEKKYEISYSFDLTTSKLANYESGTHEVTVGFRFMPHKFFETAEKHHHR